MTHSEFTPETKTARQPEITEMENPEQLEMDACNQLTQEADLEQLEMDEGAKKLGYSSNYYLHEAERAIANGNSIAYKNAMNNYAHEKAQEEAKKIHD